MKFLALALAGCAVAAPKPPLAATADAPTGRLAEPPAALRPGIVSYPDVPPLEPEPPPPPMHHHP